MTAIIKREKCPTYEDHDHSPRGQSHIRHTKPGVRYSAYCRFCEHPIYMDEIRGRLTRDIRYSNWYHEDFIVHEWP